MQYGLTMKLDVIQVITCNKVTQNAIRLALLDHIVSAIMVKTTARSTIMQILIRVKKVVIIENLVLMLHLMLMQNHQQIVM